MKTSFTMLGISLLLAAGCATRSMPEHFTSPNDVPAVEATYPLTPDETLTHLVVPDGFEVSVFAAEPDIRNPIALAWDERGRLWIVESTDYPRDHAGTESGTDRITICEDIDGDYVADTFTHFAQNQPLTTAIAVVRGGAIVGQAPHIVYMEDTDGDDVYDRKTRILEHAFGTFDTHAVMSNFKVGLDNHLWSAVGHSGLYAPGTAPDEASRILSQGVFRFSRDGQHVEPVGEFNSNTWGLGIGEDNTIFGSTADNYAVTIGIPLRYEAKLSVADISSRVPYPVKDSTARPLQEADFRGGYTTTAGAFPYNGRTYPRFFWGTLMVARPAAHVVHAVALERDGALYKEERVENLLASSDNRVAPTFADIGPDENVWVADWYDPVIQHDPDRRGAVSQTGDANANPLRDRHHGRVYVIRYKDTAYDGPGSLSVQDPEGLLNALQSSNQFWRLTAQRLIVEHKLTNLVPELTAMAVAENNDEVGFDGGAVHALWTLEGLGATEALRTVTTEALQHSSAAVRKAAIQTLPYSADIGAKLRMSGVFTDSDLNTRLAAVLRVADLGYGIGAKGYYASRAAQQGGDQWIEAALNIFPEYIGIVKKPEMITRQPAPQDGLQPLPLPRAQLMLDAPEGIVQFAQTALHAFEEQPIEVLFRNQRSYPLNTVFLQPGATDDFGQALSQYAADPDAIANEYIPPAYQSRVIGSSGVLEAGQSKRITLGSLVAGQYPYVCTVPGHWAAMQGMLTVAEAPALPRNNAGWTWPGQGGTIVYLAGSMNRTRQSHHHARVFGFADGQVLYGAGERTYVYTEAADAAFRAVLKRAELLAMANSKPVSDLKSRAAILAHVDAGKPLMVAHPAAWYHWEDWPEWNEVLVGGGARSHEPLQPMVVEVLQPSHPLMYDVPTSFSIVDELYHTELQPDSEAVVLATGRSRETGSTYPVVWLRRHGTAHILVNTLGHDERAHDHAAYRQILRNARTFLLQ